jgi:hypothetical protein
LRLGLGQLACAIAMLWAPRVEAGRPRAIVMPIVVRGDESLALLGPDSVYDEVARGLAYVTDFETIARADVDPNLAIALAGCGAGIECRCDRLLDARIDYAIEVVVNGRVKPILVTAQVVDARAREIRISEAAELGSDRSIVTLVERLITVAGWKVGGRGEVTITPSDATLQIDPEPVYFEGRRFVALPGSYRVSASKEGYAPASRELVITEHEDAKAELTLESSSFVGSLPFWLVIGGAVAAGAVVTTVLVWPVDHRIELCQGPDASGCP